MADQKISQLTADEAPTADDLVLLVDDPAGTPTSKRSTLANVPKAWGTTAAELAYTSGVTSALQTQLDGKAASAHNHDASYAALAHAAQHANGGGDPLKLDDLAIPDDNTDLDATTGRHGLLPKLGGGSTNFLRADGTWAAPAGGGGSGLTPTSKAAGDSPYAASDGDLVACDTSGGNLTVTLPTATSGHRVGVHLKTSGVASDYAVTIAGTISGGTADNKLYLAGDYLEFLADGASWLCVARSVAPHVSALYDAAGTTLGVTSFDTINLDTAIFDGASLAEFASDGIRIKRAGKYNAHASLYVTDIGDGDLLNLSFGINGVKFTRPRINMSGGSSIFGYTSSAVLNLAAGDLVTLIARSSDATQSNTFSGDERITTLSLAEIL